MLRLLKIRPVGLLCSARRHLPFGRWDWFSSSAGLVSFISGTILTGAIAETVWNTTDPASEAFQEAGNWVGVLFAVQAVGSVVGL